VRRKLLRCDRPQSGYSSDRMNSHPRCPDLYHLDALPRSSARIRLTTSGPFQDGAWSRSALVRARAPTCQRFATRWPRRRVEWRMDDGYLPMTPSKPRRLCQPGRWPDWPCSSVASKQSVLDGRNRSGEAQTRSSSDNMVEVASGMPLMPTESQLTLRGKWVLTPSFRRDGPRGPLQEGACSRAALVLRRVPGPSSIYRD
jgi:hypothetical protein